MNILSKFITSIWSQSLACVFLKSRFVFLESQIAGARRYISSVKEDSTNFTKSIAKYFEQKLPEWMGERESLEAQIEINGCKEN